MQRGVADQAARGAIQDLNHLSLILGRMLPKPSCWSVYWLWLGDQGLLTFLYAGSGQVRGTGYVRDDNQSFLVGDTENYR